MLETVSKARPRCPLPGSRRRVGAFAVCLTLCGLAGILPCLRADSAPLAAQRRDLEASVRARSALLLHDPPLRIEGLRVDVRGGVASVEGEVPSDAVLQKALGLLQNVRGIREVQNGLRIATPSSAREAPLLPLPDEKPMQTRAQASPVHEYSAPAVQLHSTLPPPQSEQYPAPPPPLRYSSAPPVPAYAPTQLEAVRPRRGRTAAVPTARTVEPPPPPISHTSVRLLPPTDVDVPATSRAAPPPVNGVGEQVEQIRQGNDHFRFLQAEVKGDTIVVHGQNGGYVMEMARQLTSLPGIKHVIVKVHSAPQ